MTPARIGPYRVVRKLGSGGMAEVFLAHALGASGFEKPVAIKRLLPEMRHHGDLERLLIEEAKQGARMRHRNLVSVHNLAVDEREEEASYYVVMEWIDGVDLHALGRPPSEAHALAVALEVAEGLAYLHRLSDERGRPLGLVHRDVSPSNILVSRHGEVKLADFGIAKATKLAETTQANLRRGKYAYMSPEQVRGEALDAQSDQFAFGVLLFELLLGRRPFDGPTPIETMDRIREARLPTLDGLPTDLASILTHCLQPDSSQRFADSDALVTAVAHARHVREPVPTAAIGAWVRSLGAHTTKPRAPTRPMTEV